MNKRNHYCLISIWTIVACGIYIATDVIEACHSGFTAIQLIVTYLAMAALPYAFLGLYIVKHQKGGAIYLIGTVMHGLPFVYFCHTALLALVIDSDKYTSLVSNLGPMYTIQGFSLAIGGLLIGYVILRKKIFPAWTGIVVILAILLNLVSFSLSLPDMYQLVSNILRNIGFMGMAYHVYLLARQLDRESLHAKQ